MRDSPMRLRLLRTMSVAGGALRYPCSVELIYEKL